MEENKNEKQENLQTEVPKAVSPQKPKKMDKKKLMKVLIPTASAVAGVALLVGLVSLGKLNTDLKVEYMVDGETYRVQEYEMDAQISLPTPPAKAGYTFIGWYTDEALTVPYAEGTITAGLKLYAKFSVSTVYIVVNTAGGEKIDPIEVAPGADYTIPEAEKAGHTFLGYTYIDENGDEQDFPLTGKYPSTVGIKITAKYAVNKYTVTFVGAGTSEQEVAYGSVAVAPNTENPGYTFDGWYTSASEQTEETKFNMTTAITGEITLYAKYSPKTFTITVNGAQAGYANPSVQYKGTYTLTAPDRGENYTFVKFVTMSGEDFPATGTYVWTENITVKAVWEGDGRDIMFFDGTTELSTLRIETLKHGDDITDIRLPAVPNKDGYATDGKWYTDAACTQEFVASGAIEADISLYAKYTANTYTVTFVVWDKATKTTKTVDVPVTYGGTINAPAKADRDAYNFDGYFYGEGLFDVNAPYGYAMNITVMEKWTLKEDASLFVDYDNTKKQFLERESYDDAWTYVYLVGVNYEWATGTELTFVSTDGNQYATVAGNVLTVNAAGTFTIQVKNDTGIEQRTIKAITPIRSFTTGGTSFDTAWGLTTDGKDYKRNSTDVWDKKVSVSAGEAMKVGATNFKPEVNIDDHVTTFDSASVNVSVAIDGKETNAYTVANGAINFNASLVGSKATVTLTPKYNIGNFQTVYYVEINNATNVYTNEDMKAAFANASVAEINVLRNITAELDASQKKTFIWDGKTYEAPLNGRDMDNNDIGGTGVYTRLSGGIKINGNYFTVDGSKLPLVDGRDGKGHNVEAYALQNVQFSIFNFGARKTTSYDVYAMNNLNIIGNGKMDANATAGYKIDGKDVLLYSGACIGVQIGSGTLNMNNVTSRLGAFAANAYAGDPIVTQDGTGYTHMVKMVAKDCKLENSWANNIYVSGFASITLDSCYIGVANGAAVHFDSKAPTLANGKDINVDCELNLVGDTDIQNWVVGTEAWFNAYNAGVAVNMIKTQLDTAVRLASEGTPVLDGNTIVGATGGKRTVVNSQSKVNFAMLMKTTGDNSEWVNDNIGIGTVGLNIPVFDSIKFGSGDQAQALNVGGKYAKFGADGSMLGFGYMEGLVEIIDA